MNDPPTHDSMTRRMFSRLQKRLQELIAEPRNEIAPGDRFDAFIPAEERRRVWRELRTGGFDLPALTLSRRLFWVFAAMVLTPVFAVAFLFRDWALLLSIPFLGLLVQRLARPLAVHTPYGCETVYEAVLHLSPFTLADYRAGLWPRKEIAARVRLIFSRGLGIPFKSIQEDTLFSDLTD